MRSGMALSSFSGPRGQWRVASGEKSSPQRRGGGREPAEDNKGRRRNRQDARSAKGMRSAECGIAQISARILCGFTPARSQTYVILNEVKNLVLYRDLLPARSYIACSGWSKPEVT